MKIILKKQINLILYLKSGVTKTRNPGPKPFSGPSFLSFRSDKKAEKIRLARPAPLRPPLPAHTAPPAPL